MFKKIDIIITTYNSLNYITQLLQSIKQQNYKQYNCFVIDDASQDNTIEIIRTKFSWVKLVVQKKNYGPARNRNIAIALGKAPYIAVLDSDVFLKDPAWLSKALKIMQTNHNIGQLASMIVSGYDEDILLDCGIQGEYPYFSGIYHKKNKNNVLGKHQISRRVLGACTAGTILRRDVFERIGGFDKRYYYLAEDLDLSLRIHLLGYDVIYEPCLLTHHLESQAMGKRAKFKNYLCSRNSLLVLIDNYPVEYVFKKCLGFLIYRIRSIIYAFVKQLILKRKNISFCEAVIIFFKILVFIILNIPATMVKRWRINKNRKRSRQYLININRQLNEAMRLKLPVKSLIYEITNKCNARCKMCFLYKELNKKVNILTLDEIRRMFQSFKELNNVVLGGGEPFLRDDIDQICDILINNNKNIAITIPTNGSLPGIVYEKTKRILGHGCNNLKISLSLDGGAEYHNENRGIPGLFSKVQECYEKLVNLKKIYGDKLTIQVNTCISKTNLDQLDVLHNYLTTNMPEVSWVFEPIRGSFNQDIAFPISNKDWQEIYNKIDKLNLDNSNLLKKIYQYSILTLNKKTQIVPCDGGEEFIAMDCEGNIRPCEILPPAANIRDINYNINELLANKNWLNIQNSIKQKKCYCTHFCWLIYSLDKIKCW